MIPKQNKTGLKVGACQWCSITQQVLPSTNFINTGAQRAQVSNLHLVALKVAICSTVTSFLLPKRMNKKNSQASCLWCSMPLISALRKQRQAGFGEFETSLVHTVPGQPGLHRETMSQMKKKNKNQKHYHHHNDNN